MTPVLDDTQPSGLEIATKLVFVVLVVYLIVDRAIPDLYVVPVGISIRPAQIVLMVVALALLVAMALDLRPLPRGIVGVVGLITVVMLLAMPFLAADSLTANEASGAERGIVQTILLVTLFLAGYYVAVRDVGRAHAILLWVVALTAIQALLVYYESLTGSYVAADWKFLNLGLFELDPGLDRGFGFNSLREGGARPTATAPHPIVMSGLLALGLLLVYALYLTTNSRRSRNVLTVLVMPMLVGMLVLHTKTGFVVLVAGGIIVAAVGLRHHAAKTIRFFLAAFGVVAAVVVFFPKSVRTMLNLFARAPEGASVAARTSDYALFPDILERHPFLGAGYLTRGSSEVVLDNSFLDELIELGVIGAVLLFALLIIITFRVVRVTNLAASGPDTAILMAGSAAGIALLLSMATFSSLKFEQFLPTIILLLGMGLARADEALRSPPPRGPTDEASAPRRPSAEFELAAPAGPQSA